MFLPLFVFLFWLGSFFAQATPRQPQFTKQPPPGIPDIPMPGIPDQLLPPGVPDIPVPGVPDIPIPGVPNEENLRRY